MSLCSASPWLRSRAWVAACVAVLVAGCTSMAPINPPIDRVDKEGGYRVGNLLKRQDKTANDSGTLFVLTFSGGGTRAAAFSYGVLEELRRTRSGDFPVEDAVKLEADLSPGGLERHIMPMEELLGSLPARVVTAEGRQWVTHGRTLTEEQLVGVPGDRTGCEGGSPGRLTGSPMGPDRVADQDGTDDEWVRLIDQEGHLVALGRTTGATLHPSVVLI